MVAVSVRKQASFTAHFNRNDVDLENDRLLRVGEKWTTYSSRAA